MTEILIQSGAVLLYVFLFACLILTGLGLSGNWIIAGVALVITLTGWGELTWQWWFVLAGLAVLGEVIEALLGMVVVARKGGTRYGVIGSFVGGLLGVILGGPYVPPLGSLALGFMGAFAGAAFGEYVRNQRADEAMRVGMWSFVGRSLASMSKIGVGVCMVWIIIVKTW